MDNVVATQSAPETSTSKTPAVKGSGEHHVGKSTGDMPLDSYISENGHDYIYEAFEMGTDQANLPNDVNNKLIEVNRHIRSLMRREGYEATTKGFKSMLEKVKSSLNIDEGVGVDAVLDRIYGYVDAEKTLRSLKNIDHEQLLEKVKKAKNRDEMMDIVMKEVGKYL